MKKRFENTNMIIIALTIIIVCIFVWMFVSTKNSDGISMFLDIAQNHTYLINPHIFLPKL